MSSRITPYQAISPTMSSKIPPKLYIAAVVLLFLLQISYSFDTLDKAKNLTMGQTLVSPQHIFEFGFFNPGMSINWYVGVWYVDSPETYVWVANPEIPLKNNSSTIAISNGSMILVDPSGKILGQFPDGNSSIANNSNDHIVQLLDSGNLVIKDRNSGDTKWQSFDYPSNTLLPGMKISKNLVSGFERYLSSWKTNTDPSKGKYYYKVETQGSPQNILWEGQQIKFRTGPWDGSRFGGVPEMKTYENMFTFKLVNNMSEVSYSFEAKQDAPLSRLVLNETGVVQRMVWDNNSRTWQELFKGPKEPCDEYMHCGPFGICNSTAVPVCSCMPGFDPRSSKDYWTILKFSGGCKRKAELSLLAGDNGFNLLEGVKVPNTVNATVVANISLDECKNRCLMNSSCLAYSTSKFSEYSSECITWSSDLLDTRYINGGQALYIKVEKSNLADTGNKKGLADAGNKKGRLLRIGITLTSTIVLLITSLAGIIVWRKKSRQGNIDQSSSLKDTELPIFDMATVAISTSNFSSANELGQGGFGVVYKGELPGGQEIAVKRLSKDSSQGLNEFMNEVMLIAKLQHRNLVRLLGCCIHGSERMLIYEFMPNKSLDFFIFDKERRTMINWETRLEIITGIARGLLYLHRDSRFNIIHRDLKAANILLDREMTPKISDFGTARLFRQEQIQIATQTIVGTRGYMAPEYAMEGTISVKSDIYSFGVLLLEIISGKRNHGNQNLLAYAWKFWEEGNAMQLADETIIESSTNSEILRIVHVALLCVQECPDDRPTMPEIVLMLSSDTTNLPEPSKPVICVKITNELTNTDDLPLLPHQFDSINELTLTRIEDQ